MAEPARQIDNEGRGSIYDEPTGVAPSSPAPNLKALEGGGETTEPKRGHLSEAGQPTREALTNAEENPSDQPVRHEQTLGAGYKPARADNKKSKVRLSYLSRRKKWGIGGAMGLIISIIAAISFLSGPLEFVHIAKLMEQFHFSHQQNAGNDRMGRLYRYARSGGHPGETRVGWLASNLHANMMADLDKIGLKPIYKGSYGAYDGFEIDRSNPKSPFKDLSNTDTIDALRNKGINIKEISIDGPNVKVTVKGYINQRQSLGFLTDEIGNSKIPGAIRVRIMSKYGLVTWHPLKILDKALNAKLADLYDKWSADRKAQLANGEDPAHLQTGSATEKDGKTTVSIAEPDAPVSSDRVKSILSSVKSSSSLKITGGIATAVGLVCIVKTVNDKYDDIKYFQVIAPLIRMGMDAVVVGNQIMSGQEVDATTVSFLAKSFNQVDSKGHTVSNWSAPQSIQSEMGNKGGVNVDSGAGGVRDLVGKTTPSWISWVNDVPGLGALCGSVGSVVTGVVSFAVGVLSGETINTVGSAIGGYLAGPLVIDKLSHFLAGGAVDVLASGAEWGNDINYGARMSGNAMSLLFGGVALSSSQTAILNAQENTQIQREFHSQSLAHRLFSPTDPYSAIARVIDSSSPSLSGNLQTIGSIFTHFSSLFSAIPKLFTAQAKAATVAPYDYGFPEYGFSQSDLNNPEVADPYDNADKAATILDSANGQAYIDKALACFGVNITKGVNGWDVIPGDGSNGPFNPSTNPYSNNYNGSDCANPAGLDPANWLRIRFFVFDTGTMEGYACYQGDDTSCSNDGVTNGATTTTSSPQTPATQTTGQPTVVIDPGHGPNFTEVDSATGLKMSESDNVPEITEVWDIAQKVKAKLVSDGYNVLLTKKDVQGAGITFRDRANVANNAHADIAISIHDDHGQSFNGFKQIYPQEVGAYRGSAANHNLTKFTDAAVAKKSQQYAQIFKQERQKAEGGTVTITMNYSFGGRGLEPGNIPMVQLFANVPWVYNEVGASGNLSATQEQQYANGLINSIEKAVSVGSH